VLPGRMNHLAKMLPRRIDGIILNDFEQGEIGSDLGGLLPPSSSLVLNFNVRRYQCRSWSS
jgi:hypothetical protein